jgi:hypothetical protein
MVDRIQPTSSPLLEVATQPSSGAHTKNSGTWLAIDDELRVANAITANIGTRSCNFRQTKTFKPRF